MTKHFVSAEGEGTGREARPRIDVTKQPNFVDPDPPKSAAVLIPVVDGVVREDLAVPMYGEIIGNEEGWQSLMLIPVQELADGSLAVEVEEERPEPTDVQFMDASEGAVGIWVNEREKDGMITTHFQEIPPAPDEKDLERWVKQDLDAWAEQSARADLALANYTLKVAEIWEELNPEVAARVKAALAKAEMERDEELADANAQMEEIKGRITDRVAVLGRTIPGTRVQAVYSPPRGVWNDDMLAGYAVEHPEVWGFRRNSKPSVSVKFLPTPRVKGKK